MVRKFVSLIFAVTLFGGCAQIVGPYYLKTGQYKSGIEFLDKRFRENPDEAVSAYYVGRFYLALEKPDQALPYLAKAVQLDPLVADYHFWLGIAHWGLLDFQAEQAAYERALDLDPTHISANLYVGHGYLDKGKWDKALQQYDKVLKLDAYNPEALFNRAVALNESDRNAEEIAALKAFLKYYPDGSMALKATAALNRQGDFTYRNFLLGNRNVTLKNITFKPGINEPDKQSRESLQFVAAVLKNNKSLKLHVIAFHASGAGVAKARARAVREYILSQQDGIDPARLPLSWFGQAETVETSGSTVKLGESIAFVTAVQ